MPKLAGKKITNSSEKIAELGNQLLNLEGHSSWEVDEIHLISKNAEGVDEKVECRWVKEAGKWVLKCFKP